MAHASPDTEYLCDYAYLDRGRVSFYFAQLFEDGVLVQTKRVAKDSSNDSSKFKASIKIAEFESGGQGSAERQLERSFDPSWLAPIEVMNRLDELSYVHTDLVDAPLGSIFLIDASMQVFDIRLMQDLYEQFVEVVLADQIAGITLPPKEKQKFVADKKKELDLVAKIVRKLPHGIQAGFGSTQGSLWSTLKPEGMLINPDDLALKHGSDIPGDWKVLGVVDSKPEDELGNQPPYVGSSMEQGLSLMMGHFREFVGRPTDAYGVTPLAIFRTIKPKTKLRRQQPPY
ncbi:hypothetical protein BSFA1_10630 [Burkholderia sp. SFA1]|nr:hypothetical protein BSFA1_10630 [Burkholderia sp. SFA1]